MSSLSNSPEYMRWKEESTAWYPVACYWGRCWWLWWFQQPPFHSSHSLSLWILPETRRWTASWPGHDLSGIKEHYISDWHINLNLECHLLSPFLLYCSLQDMLMSHGQSKQSQVGSDNGITRLNWIQTFFIQIYLNYCYSKIILKISNHRIRTSLVDFSSWISQN